MVNSLQLDLGTPLRFIEIKCIFLEDGMEQIRQMSYILTHFSLTIGIKKKYQLVQNHQLDIDTLLQLQEALCLSSEELIRIKSDMMIYLSSTLRGENGEQSKPMVIYQHLEHFINCIKNIIIFKALPMKAKSFSQEVMMVIKKTMMFIPSVFSIPDILIFLVFLISMKKKEQLHSILKINQISLILKRSMIKIIRLSKF